jgi:hypothetical protein
MRPWNGPYIPDGRRLTVTASACTVDSIVVAYGVKVAVSEPAHWSAIGRTARRAIVTLCGLKSAAAAATIALSLVLLPESAAIAQGMVPGYPDAVTAYDSREIAKLPGYCIYTQSFRDRVPGGNNQQMIDHYYSTLGTTFHALHHYCWGLMKTNRALYLARTDQARRFYFDSAIGEYDYVIERATPGFVLMPEILSRKGQNLVRLGRGAQGVIEFERAIELRPDYWPPYAYASDYYQEIGEVAKAKEFLEKALKFSPNTSALKERLARLDKIKAGRAKAQQ